jgi:phosphoribosylaminoimidazole-succinocarboxamide synthase
MKASAKRKPIYDGCSKQLFEGPELDTIIQHFKDEIEVNIDDKKQQFYVAGKGVLNNRISEYLMVKIENMGIATHFIKSINMREQLVKKLDMIPVQVVVRNVAAGDMVKRFGIEEGFVLPRPVVEFFLKSDLLDSPLINEDHVNSFGWATPFEIEEMRESALRINDFLTGLFLGCGIRLIDFKLEFGRQILVEYEQLMLADEITPDTCRLWDIKTNERLDIERLKDGAKVLERIYLEIARRLGLYT